MDGNTAKVDDALHVLESSERREVIEYLDDESVESATVSELASHLAESHSDGTTSDRGDEQSLAARLHHVHLPKLADYGVLEYDARSNTVRYRPDDRTEELLACLPTGF